MSHETNGQSRSAPPPTKKLWVAGGTGFLGSHLVRLLVAAGHQLVAVSRSGGEVEGVRVHALDVLDENAVAESAQGCDAAFLVTGKVSRSRDAAGDLHRLHVLGTRAALAGLRRAGVRRVVVASTSGTIAVSRDSAAIADETAQAPLELVARWPYYRSKLYAEREALDANSPPEFEVVIVNPSLLLGPGDLRESSTGDVRLFLQKAVPAVPAGGLAFVDVRDAALGLVLALERGKPGQRYLLNAKNLTIASFLSRLERISGVRAPILRMPRSRPLATGMSQLYAKAVRAIGGTPPIDEESAELSQYFWYCDASRAERELGFRARDPGETLRDTVHDLAARGVVFLPELRTPASGK
jgi:dihydroflavonol-4-reductase